MANAVKQFRFYGEGDTDKNQPSVATMDDYVTGNVFKPYLPIIQLGIQSLPGTMFYLNDALEPIIVGRTGIYELSLDEEIQISDFKINSNSLRAIDQNNNGYLIIDIVYDSTEEG